MSVQNFETLRRRVIRHLERIYPGRDNERLADTVIARMGIDDNCCSPEPHASLWSEEDIYLITYGDSLRCDSEPPLKTLRRFLRTQLHDTITAVHILPFFPWSSDDGFAVINYAEVNDALGDWEDIEAIAHKFDLMSDLVINHCSSRSLWYENFKAGKEPGKEYFRTAEPDSDLSQVVRPRTSPLLKPVETANGIRHVWCTFSHDQIDLDFANPQVLLEFLGIIRQYLDHGVRIFRLDAVAFLWKELGTRCINLPETHEMIRLLRVLIEHAAPGSIIITETNIPNMENLSYFGNANEAHCVYNFSLPPLLVHTLLTGNSQALKNWLMSLPQTQQGTCYLNFIASHDGIGLRPVEGLLTEHEVNQMVRSMEGFGGRISWRSLSSGQMRPYEMNIALFDACRGTLAGADNHQIDRFVCAHAMMLSLAGIPALYIHSLLGTENDQERVERTQHNRHINRHQWDCNRLLDLLGDDNTHHAEVFRRLRTLIAIRADQRAFHPNAPQFALHVGNQIFALWRQSLDQEQCIFALNNISSIPQTLAFDEINVPPAQQWRDLITGRVYDDPMTILEIAPYQTIWLSNEE